MRRILSTPRTAAPALGAAALFAVAACAQDSTAGRTAADVANGPFDYSTWDAYLGGPDSTQYSSLTQINKQNVTQLEVAWTFETGNNPRFNPLVVDGVVYFPGGSGTCAEGQRVCIVALNAATGEKLWTAPAAVGSRGMNYWQSEDGSDKRLVFTGGGRLSQIDARTGQPVASFGENGSIDLEAAIPEDSRNVRVTTDNPGRIYKDTIILSLGAGADYNASPADVYAYNLKTGEHLWTFHVIPRAGEYGADTWPAAGLGRYGGGHNWSEMTLDPELGIVYIPTGTARYDFYGGNRHGENLFTDSIVALDATTGKRIWHFQVVHHDIWDLDLPQAPKLLTVTHNGQEVKAIAQATKQGLLFAFNRITGEPLWPIEERPVPASDVPGEQAWPTQPFPTKPAPFARMSFTEADINPYATDAEKACLRELLAASRNEGLYTPPSLQGTIMMPGHNGGTNWGGAAADPRRGRMFVVSKEFPTYVRLYEPGAPRAAGCAGGGPGAAAAAPGGGRGGAPGAQAGGGRGGAPGAQAGGGRGGAFGGRAGGAGAGGGRGGRGGRGGAPAQPPPNAEAENFVAYNSPVDFMQLSNSLSSLGPPWSQITAYDLNTGEIMWQIPNGDVSFIDADENTGSHVPRGGPVATGSGLLFVGTSSDRKFRAYDADSGRELWSYDLPAASEGVPTTYEVDGRQYVVVPVGGVGYFANAQSQPPAGPGQYIAFALPRN